MRARIGLISLAISLLVSSSAFAQVEVDPYGFLKLDLIYDNAAVAPGNFAMVVPNGASDVGPNFAATANQSRFGLAIKAPGEDLSMSGKLELDLYGGNGSKGYNNAGNQPEPRLRHAFGVLRWDSMDLEILAGQTWDLFSPLVPTTVNFSVQWRSGNIGFRRPQVRVTKGISLGGDNKITLAAAVTRAAVEEGTEALPGGQGRLGLQFGKIKIGFGGHFAPEKEVAAADPEAGLESVDETHASWSGNVDLAIPMGSVLTLKAEGFFGENIDSYVGNTGPEQKSFGGWAAVAVKATKELSFHVGFAMEKAADEDDHGAGSLVQNMSGYGNVFYAILPNTKVGLEGSYWQSTYKDVEDPQKNVRAQAALIFTF